MFIKFFSTLLNLIYLFYLILWFSGFSNLNFVMEKNSIKSLKLNKVEKNSTNINFPPLQNLILGLSHSRN
jgi:hypothetical protein